MSETSAEVCRWLIHMRRNLFWLIFIHVKSVFQGFLWIFVMQMFVNILTIFFQSVIIQIASRSVCSVYFTLLWLFDSEQRKTFRVSGMFLLIQSSTLSLNRECVARQLWEPRDRVQMVVLCLRSAYCLSLCYCFIRLIFLFCG